MTTATIYQLVSRTPLTTDELELQAASGGLSGKTTVAALKGFVSVKEYGATGDGSTDDTINIQSALTAVGAIGGILYFPRGTYKITSALTVSGAVQLLGAGREATTITTANNQNIFNVISVWVDGWKISGMTLKKTGAAATSGIAINIDTSANGIVEDIMIKGTYSGVSIKASQATIIHKVDIWYFEKYGIIALGDNCNDITIRNCFINAAVDSGTASYTTGSIGIYLYDKCEGVNVFECEVIYCENALYTSAAANTRGHRPSHSKFHSCYFDIAGAASYITNSSDLTFVDCWFSCFGLNVQNTQCISFVGCTFGHCYQHGCVVAATAKFTSFNNCKFVSNSFQTTNTYSGIVFAANTTDFAVQNCIATNFTGTGYTWGQNTGIFVATGTSDRYIIADNLVSGNLTAGVSDGGSGVNKRVANNY